MSKDEKELQEFLKSRGYIHQKNVMKSTALTFIDGLGKDDIYFFLIVSFQPMSIRGSNTTMTLLDNGTFYIYEFEHYCLIEDVLDSDNSHLRLYSKPS